MKAWLRRFEDTTTLHKPLEEDDMRLARYIVITAAAASLQGCLVFIPGSVTGAISDSITGAEGNNCVGADAKIGDRIRLPGGGVGTVKSLSGTSMRCSDARYPIRALLAFE